MIRCFVAIELPPQVKLGLTGVQDEFKKARVDFVRWVSPDSIHLTLKFLGDVPEEDVPSLVSALQDAAKGTSPFELEVGGLGVFPSPRAPRVFWAGLAGDTATLKTLQESVDVAFGLLGFEEEAREFTAHLTLARVKDDATRDQRLALGIRVAESHLASTGRFRVIEMNLMKSELRPTGAVYTRLASAPFSGR